MDKKKEIIFGIVTVILCALLFAERLTGDVTHAVLGLALLVLMAVHMCRQQKKLKYKKQQIQWLDWALAADLAVLFVTGMLLHPMHGALALKIIHKLAAVLFVLGIIGHILQHRRKLHVS